MVNKTCRSAAEEAWWAIGENNPKELLSYTGQFYIM
jgi:hypothetical protein